MPNQKERIVSNEASLERFVCSLFIEWNQKCLNRIHKGFMKAENELSLLFETEEHEGT